MEQLVGEISRVIYRNAENGWSVIEVTDAAGEATTAVGTLPLCTQGERVELNGIYVEHKTYGRQFKAESCITLAPASLGALEGYLGSGLIKGVGAATAKLIVEHFGMETLKVLEEEPKRLMELPGIGRVRYKRIADSFFEQRVQRDVMMGLTSYGLSVRQAFKLYELYGTGSLARVNENPYSLIEDVEGIGFKTADKLAAAIGIEHNSKRRLRAGLRYMLLYGRQEGHTYLPEDSLISLSSEMLGVDEDTVTYELSDLLLEGSLISAQTDEFNAIYLPALYYMEKECAKRLLALCACEQTLGLDIQETLLRLEQNLEIELAHEQREAVVAALNEGAMVITGGPGTGKTTILQFILHILTRLGLDFCLCAPTGRAAKRMTEATGFEASTIHRLLEYGGEGQLRFLRNEENPLEYNMVIVDEMSMVDLPLFYALLLALPKNTRLIMVGDADQLPPVGAGTVLSDIIKSGAFSVIRLTEIFRQADRSGIAKNAQRINAGKMPKPEPASDFVFISCQDAELALIEVLALCEGKTSNALTQDPQRDIQVLSPTRKGQLGVNALNIRLQGALNPPAPHKAQHEFNETLFREGDKVMQIKNDYRMDWMRINSGGIPELGSGVYNGDLGTVFRLDKQKETLDVLFDDERMASYPFSKLEELELAYCISIHKSQGSEFPIVVLPLFSGPPMLMTRNLLYTAVTRARAQVVIVGKWASVYQMVENKRMRRRYSSLWLRINELAQKLIVKKSCT